MTQFHHIYCEDKQTVVGPSQHRGVLSELNNSRVINISN